MKNLHIGYAARPLREQRGAAALIVVMVLFFVMSMVAAYTSRNLIFEQKTATNQYRSTQASEAAEAGLEWAVAQLNGGMIDASCRPVTALPVPPGSTSFSQRYLNASTTGVLTPVLDGAGKPLTPSCLFDGSSWQCSCPTSSAPTLPSPGSSGIVPAFRMRFTALPSGRARVVQLEVNACTRPDNACLDFVAAGPTPQAGEGLAFAAMQVALKSALTTIPSAPVTVKSSLTISAGTVIEAYNTDLSGSGITVQTGGAVLPASGLVSVGPAGSIQGAGNVSGDTSLGGTATADLTFATVFGMGRETYRQQPGARLCAADPCNAAAINALLDANPGRIIRVHGDATIDGTIGSATQPVVLYVEGNVSFVAGGTVYGFIYSTGSTWDVGGPSEVVGGVFTEGALNASGGGTLRVRYDGDILRLLQTKYGSFVRVPGSWRDF